MRGHSLVGNRRVPITAGVFRVAAIAKKVCPHDKIVYTLLLAKRSKRILALTGQLPAYVLPGEFVSIRGCFLRRGDRPVLVISSLDWWPAVSRRPRFLSLSKRALDDAEGDESR